jgi:hypothetical protein
MTASIAILNYWGDGAANALGGAQGPSVSARVHLADFPFRHNERFFYEYDFRNLWQHVIRVERRLAWDDMRLYPVCLGRQRATPPEDWGGPWAFMALQDSIPLAISWSATPTYSTVSAQATPTMSGTS